MIPFKKILVPTDFGDSSQHAIELAMELAKQCGAELTLLYVWDLPSYAYSGMEFASSELLDPIRNEAHAKLERELVAVRRHVPRVVGTLRCGDPWKEIHTAITELAPDLVVMGTHGRHGLARAVLGSVTEKVVRTSPVAVLTVHAKEEPRVAVAAVPLHA